MSSQPNRRPLVRRLAIPAAILSALLLAGCHFHYAHHGYYGGPYEYGHGGYGYDYGYDHRYGGHRHRRHYRRY